MSFNVNLVHIFLVAPALAYAGYFGKDSNPQVFTALTALGLLALFFHSYRLGKSPWINLFHIFIVAPLLLYIGYMGDEAIPQAFTILLILAPIVFFYHLYRALQRLSK